MNCFVSSRLRGKCVVGKRTMLVFQRSIKCLPYVFTEDGVIKRGISY